MTTATQPTPPSHLHAFNFQTGRPRFHFDEAPPPPPGDTPPPKPWHDGVDAEIIGHWQNKGFDLSDPNKIAIEMTRQHRAAEKHFGVPADRLLRLPATDSKPEEMRAFYERLGAPKEAKDYDLSAVTDPAVADALRGAAHAGGLTKDAAAVVAKAVATALESKAATDTTLATAKAAEEKAALMKNWTPEKFDFNHLQAMEGARKSGISQEAVKAMEGQAGYASVMEHFRKIGAGMSEDDFHGGGKAGGGPTTREGATLRLSELENDKAWGKRLSAGDAVAKAEWMALTTLIGSEAA